MLEQEDHPGAHQTGHNPGVVHAGIYYQPDSLKAQLCARGRVLLKDFCIERGLPFEECGKLVVVLDPDEDGITTMRNAPSPAATSSLAIAEHVVDQMMSGG